MVFLYYLVLTLHIVACLFLIAVVLLQQGKGQDLASAFGGGGTQAAFGPRGSATVLSRATTILAGLFMVTSFSLSILKHREATILDRVPTGLVIYGDREDPLREAWQEFVLPHIDPYDRDHYETVWNGTDDNGTSVVSGVYFVRMFANGDGAEFSDLRKLLLVK